MTEIISVRINKRLGDLIRKHIQESQLDQSEEIRELIKNGALFVAIQGYSSGKYSIEKAASLTGMGLSEFIDLIASLGIKSRLSINDMLDQSDYLDKLLLDTKVNEKRIESV